MSESNVKRSRFEVSKKEKTLENINIQVLKILDGEGDKHFKIKELLKLKMPYEVSEILRIPAKEVYEEIDKMPEEEKTKIKKEFRRNRLNIYANVKELRNRGMNSYKALDYLAEKIKGGLVIELAQVYFSIGEYNKAIRSMNQIMFQKDISPVIKNKINKEKEVIEKEYVAKQIYDDCNRKKGGKRPSNRYLEEKYKTSNRKFVNVTFINGIAGMEEIDINR